MPDSRAILFDLDGTLVDTALDLTATMNVLLKRNGRREVDIADVRNMVGEGARTLMARAWVATGDAASETELDGLFDDFLEYYLAHIADFSVAFPGLEEVLGTLAQSGAKLAVCTNKPEGAAHSLLEKLSLKHHFKAIIGGDSLAQIKPHPAPVLEAIERLGCVPQNAIMIGDSKTDIHAARAANVPVIAVSFGYSREPIHSFEPDILIDHLKELPGAIEDIFSKQT